MTYKIFLDDERVPVNRDDYVIARSVEAMKEIIRRRGWPCNIAFDHDLGDSVPTGMDAAKWLVEQDLDEPWMEKAGFTFTVHSANPAGRKNIVGLLEPYLRRVYSVGAGRA